MRYTTIIDISQYPSLYRNVNIRIVYLHMCLKAGYHDEDRDFCDLSIRRLAIDVGLTISATRHALKTLEGAALITRQGNVYLVKKFIFDNPITPRAKTKQKQKEMEIETRMKAEKTEQETRADQERARIKAMRKQGRTPFMDYCEALKAKAEQGDLEALELWNQKKKIYYEQVEFFKNPENRK